MRIARLCDLVEVPWRNGGGITREIARAERDGAVAWRLSRATVAADGPFSDFAGLVRILTVTDGMGMDLWGEAGRLACEPWVPLRFDGGLRLEARLRGGPLSDLNLIFDPRVCEGDVVLAKGGGRRLLGEGALAWAVHVLSGTVDVVGPTGGGGRLAPGDTALGESAAAEVALTSDAAALLVTLAPSAQADASSEAIAAR